MKLGSLLLGACASALLSVPAIAQTDEQVAAKMAPPSRYRHHASESLGTRLDRLEHVIEEQQAEIRSLKAQINPGASGGAVSTAASAAPPQPEVSAAEFQALQSQVYEQAAASKAAAAPSDKKIHLKGVTVTFGGFAAAESVYRSHNEEADIGSSYSAIPFAGPGGSGPSAADNGRMSEFRMTARQSRVSALAEGNFDPDTSFTYYGEFDFLGAAASANSNESNSFTPRIRNLYGTVDWKDLGLEFLYGQSWSLATLTGSGMSERTELPPPSIDAQYVPGFDWTRQPQLRLVKQFGNDFWLGASVENPQTTIGGKAPDDLVGLDANSGSCNGGGTGTAGAEFNPCITLSFNHVPDLIGKLAWEPDLLGPGNVHLEVFGIYRDFYDRAGVGSDLSSVTSHDTSGGGFGAGALIKVLPGFLDLQADVMTGSGIGRYGSGQLPDVTYKVDGSLQPLNETMWMGGLTLHASSTLDLYVFGGDEQDSAKYGVNDAGGAAYNFGYGNPNFDNTGCFAFDTGTDTTCTGNTRSIWQVTPGLWWTPYAGDFGKFKVGLQYSHTERNAFTGLDTLPNSTGHGAPNAKEDMVFTSFRYYPF